MMQTSRKSNHRFCRRSINEVPICEIKNDWLNNIQKCKMPRSRLCCHSRLRADAAKLQTKCLIASIHHSYFQTKCMCLVVSENWVWWNKFSWAKFYLLAKFGSAPPRISSSCTTLECPSREAYIKDVWPHLSLTLVFACSATQRIIERTSSEFNSDLKHRASNSS